MNRPQPRDPDEPPSWIGSPAYTPYQELPAHAPMPGAPPYPANIDHPPPPVAQQTGTGYPRTLGATAVWAGINLTLVLVVSGPAPSARAFGGLVGVLFITAALAALVVWAIMRKRAVSFLVLVAVALPFFVLFRLVSGLTGV